MTQRLVLVRHARVAVEYVGRMIGATDVPLDPAALAEIAPLAARIAALNPRRCAASPLTRCRATAAAIAPHLSPEYDKNLREVDFGRWENRRFAEAAAEDPALIAQWGRFAQDFAFPEGERIVDFVRRVVAAAERLTRSADDCTLVVAHGGVIRTMLCILLGIDPRHYLAFEVPYGGLAVVDLYAAQPARTARLASGQTNESVASQGPAADERWSLPPACGTLVALEVPAAAMHRKNDIGVGMGGALVKALAGEPSCSGGNHG